MPSNTLAGADQQKARSAPQTSTPAWRCAPTRDTIERSALDLVAPASRNDTTAAMGRGLARLEQLRIEIYRSLQRVEKQIAIERGTLNLPVINRPMPELPPVFRQVRVDRASRTAAPLPPGDLPVLLAIARGVSTPKQLAQTTTKSIHTVHESLARLKAAGYITRHGVTRNATYALTEQVFTAA